MEQPDLSTIDEHQGGSAIGVGSGSGTGSSESDLSVLWLDNPALHAFKRIDEWREVELIEVDHSLRPTYKSNKGRGEVPISIATGSLSSVRRAASQLRVLLVNGRGYAFEEGDERDKERFDNVKVNTRELFSRIDNWASLSPARVVFAAWDRLAALENIREQDFSRSLASVLFAPSQLVDHLAVPSFREVSQHLSDEFSTAVDLYAFLFERYFEGPNGLGAMHGEAREDYLDALQFPKSPDWEPPNLARLNPREPFKPVGTIVDFLLLEKKHPFSANITRPLSPEAPKEPAHSKALDNARN
ncbi:hypothetical protein JCM8547_005512 [Rhodosporidiobolus lusitaniae]